MPGDPAPKAATPARQAADSPHSPTPWWCDPARPPQPYADALGQQPGETTDQWEARLERTVRAAQGRLPGQPNWQAARAPIAKRTGATPHKKALKAICRALRARWGDRISLTVRNVALVTLDAGKESERRVMLGRKGEGDIQWVYQGRTGWLEVKVGNDRQRPSQERFEARVTGAGATYDIVGTPDEGVRAVAFACGELML